MWFLGGSLARTAWTLEGLLLLVWVPPGVSYDTPEICCNNVPHVYLVLWLCFCCKLGGSVAGGDPTSCSLKLLCWVAVIHIGHGMFVSPQLGLDCNLVVRRTTPLCS